MWSSGRRNPRDDGIVVIKCDDAMLKESDKSMV
ncbi:hypothetical protein EYZ11_000696 [Aspergillus tanneri]|uniref:Uncharacterized protein n=1 Tax=Aspergillus tanneri TaxID=1220188 RepID=A0A4S3JWC0_9EURO|nr:hypothetical protein EYZ11_000696 [Aspergillus tanneri]